MKKLTMFLFICAVTLILGAMGSAKATTLLFDDFNRPDSTTIGSFWTEKVPEANIYNGKLFLQHGTFLYTAPIETTGFTGINLMFDYTPRTLSTNTLDVYWSTGDIEVSKTFAMSFDLTDPSTKRVSLTLNDWDNLASLQFGILSSIDPYHKTVIDNFEVVPNPEPATIALLGIGIAGLVGGAARRKWKKKAVDNG